MAIEPVGGGRPVDPIRPVTPNKNVDKVNPREGLDKADISNVGRLIAEIRELPELRQDKINEVRKQIEKGEFDDPDRVARALEGVINSLREPPNQNS
ncbi:MAG: flagellar biosynthesis anti-sigma factor FlgM [Planctomycetes bacterium]|nr:flagellar biosynthesis anti-sigma factor FlgM [Planctomycetota bacterium]